MSLRTVAQIRDIVNTLGNEYEILTENRAKLENDCIRLRDYIENQISQIRSLNADLEKLKEDCFFKSEKCTNLASIPELARPFPTTIPYPSPLATVDEPHHVNWEGNGYDNAVSSSVEVSLLAEIIELNIISASSFSPDGACVAVGSNKTLRVYNVDKDEFVAQFFMDDKKDEPNHVRTIAWSPDGRRVICGSEDHKIRVFDINTSALLTSFVAGGGEVYQIQYAQKEKYFAAVTGDGLFSMWSSSNFSQICSMKRETPEPVIATSLSIYETDKLIAISYSDSYVLLFDADHKRVIFETQCHSKGVYTIKFLPGHRKLATASLDNSIRFWDVYENDGMYDLRFMKAIECHTGYVLTLSVDNKGKWLLSGSKDRTAKLISLETGTVMHNVKTHSNSVLSVSISPNGTMFCTGSGDKCLKIWAITPDDSNETE